MRRENGTRLFGESTATLLVAAQKDDLEAAVRSIRLGGEVRVDRARSSRELRRLMAPSDMLPHEADDATVKIVVLDDDLDNTGAEGMGLMQELLALRPGLKLIWVTARLDMAREIEARRLGVYYILRHPVEPTLLERVITKAVEHETTRVRRMKVG
jgi:DNA-binding NtrC family response regulator